MLYSNIINLLVLFLFKEEMDVPHEAQSKDETEDETRANNTKKIKSILLTVGRKLITNPNTHATFLGLIWASIHYR